MEHQQIVDVAAEPCHRLVFENEHLRIFSVEIPAQQTTLVHRHAHDYAVVIVGDAEIGDEPLGEPAERKSVRRGEVQTGRAGFTHRVTNLGKTPFRNVVVELKLP